MRERGVEREGQRETEGERKRQRKSKHTGRSITGCQNEEGKSLPETKRVLR